MDEARFSPPSPLVVLVGCLLLLECKILLAERVVVVVIRMGTMTIRTLPFHLNNNLHSTNWIHTVKMDTVKMDGQGINEE